MNEERFDITCTATLRAELLERTFSSFVENLFKERIKQARLIINIDLIGAKPGADIDEEIRKIVEVVQKYNFADITPRWCKEPNFANAWFWCMGNIREEMVFNLEEDWELQFPIDFDAMWKMFHKYTDLAHLRLSQFPSSEVTCKNWNMFLHWNGDFFEVLGDEILSIGWAGHPSFNRSEFIEECLPYIDRDINPEKQIKGKIHPCITKLIKKHRFGSFHPQNSPASIVDTGREWMVKNGWSKKGNKAWFTTWERSE